MSEKNYPPHSELMYEALAKKKADCGLVQSDVAIILGVDRGYLNTIFTGKTELTANMAKRIAFVLDLDALELLNKQSAWKLSNTPHDKYLTKRIKERVRTLESRKSQERTIEIQNLEKERESINERILELRNLKRLTMPENGKTSENRKMKVHYCECGFSCDCGFDEEDCLGCADCNDEDFFDDDEYEGDSDGSSRNMFLI